MNAVVKVQCPVKGCKYACGVQFAVVDDDDEDGLLEKRIEFAKQLRDEHPAHPLALAGCQRAESASSG